MAGTTGRISIYLTGATGYIGGSVLQRILGHPKAHRFDITVLVRSAEKAKLFETQFGLKAAIGSLQDLELLTKLSSQADIVIHAADADDEDAMHAILKGLKQRYEKSGERPSLIHTSGIAVIADDARGAHLSPTVLSDLDQPALDAIPPTAPHHTVDLLAVGADAADGFARTYLVMPSVIYGIAKGVLVDTGLAKAQSLQVPWLARAFMQRGRAGVVGSGVSRWSNVHVDDNAQLYYLLFDAVLKDPESISHGRTGYYFVENGEHSQYDLCKALGGALVALGRVEDAEPTVFSPEERLKHFGSDKMAYLHFSNARVRADRARKELGWTPRYTTDDLLTTVQADVELVMSKELAQGTTT